MPRLDAVALDLDGTLLESRGLISERALAALGKAAAAGTMIFIATGRPQADVAALVDRNGLGAAAWPHALVCEERDIHDRAGTAWVSREPRNTLAHGAELAMSEALRPVLAACLPALAALDPTFDCFPDETVARRGFFELHFATTALTRQAAELLRPRLAALAVVPRIVRNGRLVALRAPGGGKGPVLAELVAGLGLAPGAVLAIGDSDNDRSMLDGSCGFLAAVPANADPDLAGLVAARGGLLCTAARSLGVAEAVEVMMTP